MRKRAPFVARVGGEEFTFSRPDVRLFLASPSLPEGPRILRAMLGEQYEAFTAHKVPLWKMAVLARAVRAHYGAEG